MTRSETDSDEESSDSLIRLKNKVRGLNKTKLKEFLFTIMDECDALHSGNCELKDTCDELKGDIRELEHEKCMLFTCKGLHEISFMSNYVNVITYAGHIIYSNKTSLWGAITSQKDFAMLASFMLECLQLASDFILSFLQ